jgi:hypothetical protein
MCAAWRPGETLDRIRLGVVRLEHGQQFRDGEQILNALREVQQLELPPLPAHRGICADDFAQARAIDVGDAFEVQHQLFLVLLDERVDLVLQELVAFSEGHLALEVQNRHIVDDSFVDLHRRFPPSPSALAGPSAPAGGQTINRPKRPAPGPTVSKK